MTLAHPLAGHLLYRITIASREAIRIPRPWMPVLMLLTLLCACKGTASIRWLATPGQSSEGFIIAAVQNEPPTGLDRAATARSDYSSSTPYISTARAIQLLHSVEHEYGLREIGAWPVEPLHMHCAVLEIPERADRASLLARLLRDPRIKLAEPLETFSARVSNLQSPPPQSR
jgi:hypothetical protein